MFHAMVAETLAARHHDLIHEADHQRRLAVARAARRRTPGGYAARRGLQAVLRPARPRAVEGQPCP